MAKILVNVKPFSLKKFCKLFVTNFKTYFSGLVFCETKNCKNLIYLNISCCFFTTSKKLRKTHIYQLTILNIVILSCCI